MPPAEPVVRRRLSAYAVVSAGDRVLLTRISALGHHTGDWTLPGGGIDHGESPRAAVTREVWEETGLEIDVGDLLDVHDTHFTGHAPDGTLEDFHGVHLIFAASTPTPEAPLRIVEADGTTDAVDWVERSAITSGELPVLEVVRAGLSALDRPSAVARSVADRHRALGVDVPAEPSGSVPSWREQLARLEGGVRGYAEAAASGDTVEVADALADLLSAVYGTALTHGIPLDAVFDELQRAHSSKDLRPIFDRFATRP